jgi:hypothetical protein
MRFAAFVIVSLMILPSYALAYVGPGLSAGTLGAILGVVGAVLLALFAVVYYPIKRLLRKRRKLDHEVSGAKASKSQDTSRSTTDSDSD